MYSVWLLPSGCVALFERVTLQHMESTLLLLN